MATKTEASVRAGGQTGARIGRSNWIGAAIGTLAREGIAAVRVEALAVKLKVTKGSFYWHFADRETLYDAMLEHWRAIGTAAIIERVERGADTPRAKLRYLIAMTARSTAGVQLETAMRSWGARERKVAAAIAAADRERVAYVSGLLRDLGLTPAAAELRARILYLAVIGSYFSVAERMADGRDLWREAEALIA